MKSLIFSLLVVAASAIPFEMDYGKELEAYFEDDKPSDKPNEVIIATAKPEGEDGLIGTLLLLEKLMMEAIEDVHPNDKGFVPHKEIEEAGGEIIELVIKAIKPVKKFIKLAVKDFKLCDKKLEALFGGGHRRGLGLGIRLRAIKLQAGQCFFVIHRPFVVLLKQAFEKGLFDKLQDKDDDKREKRDAEGLARDLIEIFKKLGHFSDGKIDLPYVLQGLTLLKEKSEFLKEIGSLSKLIIGDYIALGHKLLILLKFKKIDEAKIAAGEFYLSYARRIMKIMAVIENLSEDHDHHNHHGEGGLPEGPSNGPGGDNGPSKSVLNLWNQREQ